MALPPVLCAERRDAEKVADGKTAADTEVGSMKQGAAAVLLCG